MATRTKRTPQAPSHAAQEQAPPSVTPLHLPLVAADTRTRLLQAAMAEFIEAGFAGTDTNRIARRAGFAPQTFYRWFSDKTAIFIEVLHVWEEVEAAMLRSIFESPDVDSVLMAEACVESFRPFLTFRRNLRTVLAQAAEIRLVRAQGRRRLITMLAGLNPSLGHEALGSLVVQFEQLCEALAQGELEDMGLSGTVAMKDLAKLIERLTRASPVGPGRRST